MGNSVQLPPGANGYLIEFISEVCNNGTQTWTYKITTVGNPTPAMSHWTLVLCSTGPIVDENDVTFPESLDLTIETNGFSDTCFPGGVINGIKWDSYDDQAPDGFYSFTIQGCFQRTDIDVAVKAGSVCPDENKGKITGPSCFSKSRPPRGTPFSEEEKLTAIFRKGQK